MPGILYIRPPDKPADARRAVFKIQMFGSYKYLPDSDY